jgi:hypothetical protein
VAVPVLLYFGAAHLALFAALVLLAARPESITGVVLMPQALATLHLVTLGWIALSIFGALHVVGPLAFRMRAPKGVIDQLACFSTVAGVAGFVLSLLVGSFDAAGVLGLVLLCSFAVLSARTWAALAGSKAPAAIKAHIGLSCANLLLASLLGALVAFDRGHTWLPGDHLGAVLAHAHLAGLGFATLMFVGVGYRLLPMFLPAAPPTDRRMWATVFLLEVGVLGLAVSLWLYPPTTPVFATVAATGLAVFFSNLLGMLRHRKPAPVAMRRPDPGMLQTLVALVYLLLSGVLGLFLVFEETFLSQAILGVGMRLLPLAAWTEAWSGSGYTRLPPSPHEMPARPWQFLCFGSWVGGVPLLGYGLACSVQECVAAGAWLLLGGSLCGAVSSVRVLTHALGSSHNSKCER